MRHQALYRRHKWHHIAYILESREKTIAEELDDQTVMFCAEAAGLFKEFPQHGRDDKIAFLSLKTGGASDIAKDERQSFSEGSRGFHFFHSQSPRVQRTRARVSSKV